MKNTLRKNITLLAIPLLFLSGNALSADEPVTLRGKTYVMQDNEWYVIVNEKKRFKVNTEIITIKFKKDTQKNSKDALIKKQQLNIYRTNKLGYIDIKLPAGTNPIEYVQKLQQENIIESAEVNIFGEYTAPKTPDDPNFANQWHLPKINAAPNPTDSAWDITTGSSNIIVAILDSGTDVGHEDLIGNVWINPLEDVDNDQMLVPANADHLDADDINTLDDDGNGYVDDLAGWDFHNNDNNVRGPFYHGTHVAGIVGARTNNTTGVAGVAGGWKGQAGVKLMAVGVGDNSPDSAALDDAIIYAADNGARVITMSLTILSNAAVDSALDYAYNTKGVFINNAAGNGNGSPVSYPANNPNVVAVSSTNQTDNLSGFSNLGPEIELAAPGEQIWSTRLNNTYGQGPGTSYASPQVAGTAGLVLSCKPSLTNKQVRKILQTSATDLGAAGRDNSFGFGRLDALAALEEAGCKEGAFPYWYIGLALGFTNTEIDSLDTLGTGGLDTDDSDTAIKLFAGRRLGPNFGVEFGYIDLGEYSQEIPGTERSKFESTALFVELVSSFNVYTGVNMFGKLGLAIWNTKLHYTDFNVSSSDSDTGLDTVVGLGFDYRVVGTAWSLRLEWEQFQNVGEGVKTDRVPTAIKSELNGQNIDVLSLGLTYRF